MQIGYLVMVIFYVGDIKKMIQCFIGYLINVLMIFIDNLNIVVFQQVVYVKGKFFRRIISVVEIEGYYEEFGGVVMRNVFEWDLVFDRYIFCGFNNLYILERKIVEIVGYEDFKDIYNEFFLRVRIF